ncbi:hypothetical protein [Salinimicrobium flavum]|uniref:Uncharacterized protein n=1 Tax=Salinimicrobium flavum TaxID=1737065 RepID=A0ABW5IZR0_9FLAO
MNHKSHIKNPCTLLFLCLVFLFQSCSEKDNEKCDGACTEEYRTIIVKIVDSEDQPVALDSFKVVNLKNGRDLTIQVEEEVLQSIRERGSYPLFSDKYVQEYIQQQLDINFTGLIEGEEVVSEDYKVGADCCHVYHISGDLELTLE